MSKKISGYFRYFQFHKEIIRNITIIGDSNQIKQIKTIHETLLEFLDYDENTKKKIIKVNENANDPLLEKYQQQTINEKNKMNPITNLLEDSDQEKQSQKNFKTEKSNSNFKFISQCKGNSIKRDTNSIPNINKQNSETKSSANNIINSNKNQNNNNIIKINSDLATINWDVPFENKIPNNTNLNLFITPKNESVIPPLKSNQTSNYKILDSLPDNYPNFNYISQQQQISHIQPSYLKNNNYSADPSLMTNNNLNKQNQATFHKKEEAKKETAFDFVNDLIQMK